MNVRWIWSNQSGHNIRGFPNTKLYNSIVDNILERLKCCIIPPWIKRSNFFICSGYIATIPSGGILVVQQWLSWGHYHANLPVYAFGKMWSSWNYLTWEHDPICFDNSNSIVWPEFKSVKITNTVQKKEKVGVGEYLLQWDVYGPYIVTGESVQRIDTISIHEYYFLFDLLQGQSNCTTMIDLAFITNDDIDPKCEIFITILEWSSPLTCRNISTIRHGGIMPSDVNEKPHTTA